MTDLKLTPPMTTKLSVNFGVTTVDAILRLLFKWYPDGSSDTKVAARKEPHLPAQDITIFTTGTGSKYSLEPQEDRTVMFYLQEGRFSCRREKEDPDYDLHVHMLGMEYRTHRVTSTIPGDVYDSIVAAATKAYPTSRPKILQDNRREYFQADFNLRVAGLPYELVVIKSKGFTPHGYIPYTTVKVVMDYSRVEEYVRPIALDGWWPILHISSIFKILEPYIPDEYLLTHFSVE